MSLITFPINEDYYDAVIKGISMTWERLLKEYNEGCYDDTESGKSVQYTLRHCRSFLFNLYIIRECIRTGKWPDTRDERDLQVSHPGHLINDMWDWEDPLAVHLTRVFNDFHRKDRFDLTQVPPFEPDIEEIHKKFETWKLAFRAEENKREGTSPPAWLNS